MATLICIYQSSQKLGYIFHLDVHAKFPLLLMGDNVGVSRAEYIPGSIL